MPNRLLGYLLLSLAMVTVGSTVAASRLIAGSLPPFAATALRFAWALPLLLALARWLREPWPRLARGDWWLLLFQAGAGSVGYTVLLISGLARLPAADAGVVLRTLPAVSALFSVLVLGERPGLRLAASVLLASLGVVAVAWRDFSPSSLAGMLCILGAVVCESAFILLNKRMRTPLRPLPQAVAMTGLGLLLSLPRALLEWPMAAFVPAIAMLAAPRRLRP